MQVPHERPAPVEGPEPADDALDVLGEGVGGSFLGSFFRHGLHVTIVGLPGSAGVRLGAVYEMRA
ncbi:hypothetical protein GCM10010279_62010 [Streptomyces mutabilis]|nr:hypothetical protein GCM10010279_62010 [Streptomyces mutabilis]